METWAVVIGKEKDHEMKISKTKWKNVLIFFLCFGKWGGSALPMERYKIQQKCSS
jgi:hypothetical protein